MYAIIEYMAHSKEDMVIVENGKWLYLRADKGFLSHPVT